MLSHLLAWLLFAATLLLAWRPWAKAETSRYPVGFAVCLLACLGAFRWPILQVPQTLNIDESQMIAGAMTLRHDPVFWRSIEGQTIGPLDYYALVPGAIIAPAHPYFAARLLGLLLVGSVLVITYFSARRVWSERSARWSALLLLAFFAFTTEFNFVHYSSEHLPICLLAIAMACLCQADRTASARWLFVAGFALGAVPFAKLQAAPIAAALFGGAVIRFGRPSGPDRSRRLAALFGGSLVLPVIVSGCAVGFGVAHDMMVSYFKANLFYAGTEESSRLATWKGMAGTVLHDGHFGPLLLAAGLVTVIAVLGSVSRSDVRTRFPWPFWVAAVATLAAVLSVMVARRTFAHYLLLLTPGLGFLCAWALAAVARSDKRPGFGWQTAAWITLVGVGLIWPAGLRIAHPGAIDLPSEASDPTILTLQRWLKPGDALAIWGWEPRLFVATGCRQATRDPSTRREIEPSPDENYYRRRYLGDLARSNPRVLIDTTTAHRQGYGFESFPEFQRYLAEHYRLATEVNQRRIYLRRDLASSDSVTPSASRRAP